MRSIFAGEETRGTKTFAGTPVFVEIAHLGSGAVSSRLRIIEAPFVVMARPRRREEGVMLEFSAGLANSSSGMGRTSGIG